MPTLKAGCGSATAIFGPLGCPVVFGVILLAPIFTTILRLLFSSLFFALELDDEDDEEAADEEEESEELDAAGAASLPPRSGTTTLGQAGLSLSTAGGSCKEE